MTTTTTIPKDVVPALMSPNMTTSDQTVYEWHREGHASLRFVFRIIPDEWTALDDYDYYGKTAPVERHPWRYGCNADRPDGFDGAARIVASQSCEVWWQPPAYVAHDPVERDRLRRLVANVLEHGFSVWELVVEQRCGSCGTWEYAGQAHWSGQEPLSDPDESDMWCMVTEALESCDPAVVG
jgi:hypothetical protein